MMGNKEISSGSYRAETNSHRQPRIYGQVNMDGKNHNYGQPQIYGQSQTQGQPHIHEHEITKCLHKSSIGQPKGSAGAAAGGVQAAKTQPQPEKESFSLRDFFADGFRSFVSRVSGFWRRLGEEDGRDMDSSDSTSSLGGGKGVSTVMQGSKTENGPIVETEGKTSIAILGTAVVKPEIKKEESPETARRRVNQVEGSISGGLKKGQGGIKKFLQKFGETAARAGRFLGRKKREEAELLENNTDLNQGDSSFLLDSYNRMGEYSTLAKDRSREGNFRAKG